MYSCEKDNTTIVDPVLNIPTLDSASVSPLIIDSSRININLRAYVTSIDPIQSVTARFIDPDGNTFTIIELTPNGSSYFRNYDTTLSCRFVGDYRLEFVAVTSSGLNSNSISKTISVINSGNVKPVISLLYAPDSLQRPTDTILVPAFLKVQVTDPNGECDIREAYFNSVNPLGIPNPFNPFTMYDNGNVSPPFSDTVANDKKFSLTIYIGQNATLGDYTFKFTARDRSFMVSDTLYKTIRVYQ
jgi:hypothetical protein